jgi:hypothetical protein
MLPYRVAIVNGVVRQLTTDEVITDAVRRESSSRLEAMARHGMRVESGEPLQVVACLKSRSLEFINFLVAEMGAEVNEEWKGKTALMVATLWSLCGA